MTNAIVIRLTEGGDLYSEEFESVTEARRYVDGRDEKCYIIYKDSNSFLHTEDHT